MVHHVCGGKAAGQDLLPEGRQEGAEGALPRSLAPCPTTLLMCVKMCVSMRLLILVTDDHPDTLDVAKGLILALLST